MEYRVIIAGFGGQGILSAGKALAQAALDKGHNVSWLPSYGPEMRGGTCNCRIVISDREISSPYFNETDALIAASAQAAEKFSDAARQIIVTRSEYTELCRSSAAQVIGADIPAVGKPPAGTALLREFMGISKNLPAPVKLHN